MQLILMVYSMIIAWLAGMWAWIFWVLIKDGKHTVFEYTHTLVLWEFIIASFITLVALITVAIMARRLARRK